MPRPTKPFASLLAVKQVGPATGGIKKPLEALLLYVNVIATKSPKLLTRKLPFQYLVHEIAQGFKTDIHLQSFAIDSPLGGC